MPSLDILVDAVKVISKNIIGLARLVFYTTHTEAVGFGTVIPKHI
jgi:hypothetical protein